MRLAILAFLTCLAALVYSSGNPTHFSMDWYDEAWAKVDSLDQEGLPKSALEVVEDIYARAQTDSNDPHLIKSLLYRSRYRLVLEEEVSDKVFADLNDNLDGLSGPSQAVLHSIIGQLYWQYFEQNRYRFYNRTAGGAVDEASIETWDLRKIVATALGHYRASLADPATLKEIDVDAYLPIVSLQKDSRTDRPTLYDFLAHRALDVLQNGESALTSPVDPFRLVAERDLAPAAEYLNAELATSDSLSLQAEVLRIYQSLLALHSNDRQPDAFVHADLRRLAYVRSQLSTDHARELYLSALDSLAARHRDFPVYAEIRHAFAAVLVEKGRSYDPLGSDSNKWQLKEATLVCDEAIELHPGSRGSQRCASLQTELRQKRLNVQMQAVVLPGQSTFARIEYQNLSLAHVKVVRISRDEAREWAYSSSRQIAALTETIIKRESVYEDELMLPDDGDMQLHSTLFEIPALAMGPYALLVGSSASYSVDRDVRFSGTMTASFLSYIERREPDGGNRLYTLNRESGHPIEGVSVVGYRREGGNPEPAPDQTDRSDSNGMVRFGSLARNYNNLELTHRDDWLFSGSGLYSNRRNPGNNQYPETRFFTDRAIYRPGQTIHFKGILLQRDRDEYSIRARAKTTVAFYDVNGREIGSQELTSNDYGTVAGQFVAPRGVLTGRMTIRDSHGSTVVSVEEYKRPRFEVQFDPVTEAVALGDSIRIRGSAKSLAGAAIGYATVQFSVTRSTYFPWWGYRSWRPWPRSSNAEIAYGTVQTDADGTFAFSFVAAEDESLEASHRPTYNYSVVADVTDISGETRGASTSISAARESVFLTLNVPDRVDADHEIELSVGANNVNGQPLPFEGEVRVTRLEKPGLLIPSTLAAVDTLVISRDAFKQVAPHEAYLREGDPATWKRGKVVLRRDISGDGTATLTTERRVKWKPGYYEVKFAATNEAGESIESVRYTTVFSSRDDDAPGQTLDWFAMLTPTVEPGERARYLIGSTEKNVRVLVELEHDGKIINSEWIRLSREQKERSFAVVEEYRGNVALHFTFAWKNHVFRRTETVNVPWTNKQLSMTWETFRSKLYPGQDETWRLKISGPKGEAVAAEMVATLYD
ncbi:MAG: hypothetical protein HKN13_03400, partial [Rhodothermales bacterium]|nr:hypothetical protein [Rhodothermales bacterium]